MKLLLFLTLNLTLVLASYWLSAPGGFPGQGRPAPSWPSRADRWLAWGVVAGALPQAVLIAFGAGLKNFAPAALAITMAAMAALALGLARRLAPGEVSANRFLRDVRLIWNLISLSPGAALAATLLLGTYSMVVLLGLLLPPFAHDSLMYHLLMSGTWLQQGHLGFFPAFGLIRFWTYYPGGGELIFLWNLLPIRSDLLVDLSQLPFAWLGGLAAYGLARKFGARPREALWAGGAYLMTPIVIIQSRTSYVDVIFASVALASLNFLILFARTLSLWHLVIAGLAAGGMIGVKGSGLLYLGFFLIPILAAVIGRPGYVPVRCFKELLAAAGASLRAAGAFLGSASVFVSAAGVVGGFWYIRNFLATGNPTFPFAFRIPGLITFPGPLNPADFFWSGATKFFDTPWQWIWAPVRDLTRWVPTFTYENGFGPHLLALGLPGYFLAVGASLRRRDWPTLSIWIQAPLIISALFLLQPFKEPRYLLIPAGLAGVAAALVLARFPRVRGWLELLLIVSFIFSALTSIPAVAPTHSRQALRTFKAEREKLHPNQVYMEQRGRLARTYALLELLGKPGDVVIWDFLDLQYPLFGRNFKFRLTHVPFSEPQEEWLENLSRSGAVWLVTKPGSTPAGTAARNRPDVFFPVSGDVEDNVFFVGLPQNRERWEEVRGQIEAFRGAIGEDRGPTFLPFPVPGWLSAGPVLWTPVLALFTGVALVRSLQHFRLQGPGEHGTGQSGPGEHGPGWPESGRPGPGRESRAELAFLLLAGVLMAYYLGFHQEQIENTRVWWSEVLR